MKTLRYVLSLLIVTLAFSAVPTFAADKADKAAAKTDKAAAKTNSVSDADIAAAKAAGKVWVNTNSENKVYHAADSKWYGKTKQGQFMTEADAQKAGYHAAKSAVGAKKSAAVKK